MRQRSALSILMILMAASMAASPGAPAAGQPAQAVAAGLPPPGSLERRVAAAAAPHEGPGFPLDKPLSREAVAADRRLQEKTQRIAPEIAGAPWRHLGPTNFGGRVADMTIDPADGDVVYAATASGGLWKSLDGATSFEPAWPSRAPQAVGAVAVSAQGDLFAGTGEANPGGGGITFGGNGILRSRDGGATWRNVGLRSSGAFGRIVVDPSDPRTVYAAASGDLYTPGGERGLYRSEDSGRTWDLILPGDNDTTGAVDVALSPSDPERILVAMWDHQRLPTHRRYGGPGSGLYLTTDGGDSWRRIPNVRSAGPEETGRIGVAFAPSDPNRAYAVVADLSGDPVGLWTSVDAGKTWIRTGAQPGQLSQSTFAWWFGRIFVDPDAPERLFVAGVELVESIDGGNTFVPQSNGTAGIVAGAFQAGPTLHPDQHAMVWDPTLPGRVYLGNDGGVYRSLSDGRASSWVASAAQGWTQHYSVDVSEQEPSRIVSGLQDNLCQRNYLAGSIGLANTWTKYGLCGDGLQTLINFENDNIVYGCAQYGANCSKTVDGGVAFVFLGEATSSRFGWWAPMVFDPSDADIMYMGGNILNRSPDGGTTWQAISPDLTTNPVQLDPSPGYRIYGTITTISVSPADPEVIWVGTDDGLLWRTVNTGRTWKRIEHARLPQTWVTSIAADRRDPRTAYVALSAYRGGEDTPYILMTRDGGRSWRDLSSDLPPAPLNDVIVVKDGLVVGTNTGVYLRRNTSSGWLKLGRGLPVTPVFDLRFHAPSSSLTIATFGHGIQRVRLPRG